MESTESLHQMAHLDDVLPSRLLLCHSNRLINTRGIEDGGETVEDDIRLVDALHPALMQEGDTLTATHLIKIGCGGDNGDATLFQGS